MNNKTNTFEVHPGKVKHKFNFIDFLVLLLIVAVVGTSIYAVFSWSDIEALWSASSKEIQYVVELRGVDKDFVDKIKTNDIVIDSVTKNQLGTVHSADEVDNHFIMSYTFDDKTNSYTGALINDTSKRDITVYISATAKYEKDVGYTVNGIRIAVGEILEVRFPQFATTAYCIHISESGES